MKVITAIGNDEINIRLRSFEEYEVIGRDIQYEEGIIEIIEEIKDIDLVILSNNLPGEFDFKVLINKLINMNKNIQIVVLLKEKNQDIENFLNSKKIYKIYYLNNIELLYDSLKKDNLSNFRNEIVGKIEENKLLDYQSSEKNNKKEEENNLYKTNIHNKLRKSKVIAITGLHSSGKSIFSLFLAKIIKNNNKSVIIIDSSFIFEKNDYIFYKRKIEIVKINKKINLHNTINKLKNKYDYILVDLSLNKNNVYYKNTLEIADLILLLIEPNLSEINKTNYLLNVNCRHKTCIILNKSNINKISKSILNDLFQGYEIIGEIKYNKKYNLYINSTIEIFIDLKEYKKIYEKIERRNYGD